MAHAQDDHFLGVIVDGVEGDVGILDNLAARIGVPCLAGAT
jgi:hypothetical protein